MAQEIERKFLVTGDYKPLATHCSHIIQGYICSARGRTVRVRLRDNRGYLTIKGPSDEKGLSRYEFEQEISEADARQLLKLCEPGIIDKNAGSCRPATTPTRLTNSSAKMPASSWPKSSCAARMSPTSACPLWAAR